jgi:alpha-L-fucosidase 2
MSIKELFLTSPAVDHLGGFPLGNGRIGAIFSGGAPLERMALNHECLWRGVNKHILETRKVTKAQLSEIRSAIFSGDYAKGHELSTSYLSGPAENVDGLSRIQPYQPFGDLHLEFRHSTELRNYERRLNLEQAIATSRYFSGNSEFTREAFISAPHQVLVIRLRASEKAALSVKLWFSRIDDPDCESRSWVKNESCGIICQFVEGIKFAGELQILSHDGNSICNVQNDSIEVDSASEIVIALTLSVDLGSALPFSQPDPVNYCTQILNDIPRDYDLLVRSHLNEYQAFFERFKLDLAGTSELSNLPTNERQQRLATGKSDPELFAIYNDFARYLMLSSSRNCDLPSNLQGLWNEELRPPWQCYFSTDINLEMNYWPAEGWGLGECIDPLFSHIERNLSGARKSANDYYGCRGIHLFTGDIWQMSYMSCADWDVWSGTSAMIALHYWWRYEYSLDLDVLANRVYPFLKEVALFYEDFMTPDLQGRLVACPTMSPENSFSDGREGAGSPSYCFGATMDTLLALEVFEHAIEASCILEIDEECRTRWKNKIAKLAPFQKGKYGQLLEWIEDFTEMEPGHRHLSHLYGVFPGESMSSDNRKSFYDAAKISLKRRLDNGAGKEGWSLAWATCLLARFLDSEAAYDSLRRLIANCSTEGLLDVHPHRGSRIPSLAKSREPLCFQIDGNFGGSAAMLELLAQSHGNVVRILPALPSDWPSGSIKGLRLRKSIVLDVNWTRGALVDATLYAKPNQLLDIILPQGDYTVKLGAESLSVIGGKCFQTSVQSVGKVEIIKEQSALESV